MYKHENMLDINKLYTNDIHAMQDKYGIEAACRILVKVNTIAVHLYFVVERGITFRQTFYNVQNACV